MNLVMKHQAACVLVYPSTRQVNWFVGIRLGQLVVLHFAIYPFELYSRCTFIITVRDRTCNEK